MEENILIQKVLDELQRRTKIKGRAPLYLNYADIQFVQEENYTKEQLRDLRIIIINSGIFAEHNSDGFELNEAGKEVKSVYNWNYEKYLDSKRPKVNNDHWSKASVIATIVGAVGTFVFGITTCVQNQTIDTQSTEIKLLESKLDSCLSDQNR